MNARGRLIGCIALALVIVVAAWVALVSPKRSQVSNLSAQITAEQGAVATDVTELTAGKQARAAYGKQIHAIDVVDKSVPLSDEEPSLIKLIDREEKGYAIGWQSASFSPGGAASGSIGAFALDFSYTTTKWSNLQRFFAGLDNLTRTDGTNIGASGRLFTIDSLSVQPDGPNTVQASVSMTAYVLPDTGAAGTTSATATTTSAP